MAVFTDSASLFYAIQQELGQAMTEVDVQSFLKAHENAVDFYSVGDPKQRYRRTGTYGSAPDTTGVTGGGNSYETEIYMEAAGHGYRTGTFSAQEVWEAAEDGSYGVLGKSGRWAQTEKDVEQIIKDVFGSHFSI